MSEGGGFCEKHGPFDPPNLMCPYCAKEDQQRRHYGPPPIAVVEARPPEPSPAPPPEPDAPDEPGSSDTSPHVIGDDLDDDSAQDAGFVRQTVEPAPRPEADRSDEADSAVKTEVIGRDGEDPDRASDDAHAPLGWLIVKEPAERRGTVLAVRANQIIGRSGDVRWDDPRLSRQHARVTLDRPADAPDDPPVFHLWPFGTTNPVYLNGQEIRGATPLRENDEVRLGETLFVFKVLVD
jgi:pSer/pThr/pTyr-binding forkhead associated (FHA) protein